MNPEKKLTIVGFKAENVKRIQCVEINPDGNVIIGGNNAQGKTTILDAIWYALGGAKDIADVPLRKGAETGFVSVDLGDFVITRSFEAGGKTALELQSRDGLKMNSGGQGILDAMLNKLTRDPLAFLSMAPKQQRTMLLDIIGVDTTALDQEYANVFAARTETNRDVKRLETEARAMEVHEGLPKEEVSVAELSKQAGEAERINRTNDEARRRQESTEDELARRKQLVKSLTEQLREAEAMVTEYEPIAEGARKYVASLADIDISAIYQQISEADDLNLRIRERNARNAKVTAYKEAEAEAQKQTKRLAAILEEKAQALRDAKFPVPGLAFDEGGVLLNGLPFEQASSAEQLRVSVAMCLALAGKLNVVFVDQGSLLDAGGRKTVYDMCAEAGAQLWMTVVGEDEEASVIMEDGRVKDPKS